MRDWFADAPRARRDVLRVLSRYTGLRRCAILKAVKTNPRAFAFLKNNLSFVWMAMGCLENSTVGTDARSRRRPLAGGLQSAGTTRAMNVHVFGAG